MPVEDYSSKEYLRRSRQAGDPVVMETDAEDWPTTRLSASQRVAARHANLDEGRYARQQVVRRTKRRSPLRFVLGLGVALVLALLTLPYAIDLLYDGQVLPGVSVQGVSVAGISQNDLRATLAARYGQFLGQPVVLSYNQQQWQPTLPQLGVRFDADTAMADVLAAGRRGNPLNRLEELWALWHGGLDVAPRVVADRNTLVRYLLSLTNAIEQPPRDAALSVTEGKVIGTPSDPGRQMLADQTADDILHALGTLAPQTVAVRTRELAPAIDDAALRTAEQHAHTLLNSPITLLQGDRSWTWQPDRLADLLDLKQQDNGLQVQISQERLTQAVERLAQLTDSGSAEPRARFIQNKLTITQEGQLGQRLLQPEALAAISTTLQTNQGMTRTLVLPVETIQPKVTHETLASLGVNELIGEGKSSFEGSAQYRITNIKAGAARMDGVLIPPDSEFSFNTQLGEVDEANGFVEGYAVVNSRTQLEWGGGVCQDSTTVFRAAFWAGLPITERHAHPFYISWYDKFGLGDAGNGAGLDAAIYTGVNDLKFANNTKHWIMLQAAVDEANQVLTVRLYGTKDRTVQLDGPDIGNEIPPPATPRYVNDSSLPSGTVKQTDTARSGRDITVYRTVTVDGVRGETESFNTHFQAWPNVFVRGTG